MGANVFAVQNTAGYVWRSKPWLPCPDDVCRSLQQHYSNRVCASQGRSHKRSEVVVVTPYGCTRVCSSSVNADLRASYQAKAPNATDTTAAMANNIHIAGFPPNRNTQLSPEWQCGEGRRKTALAALRSTVRAGAAFDIDSLFVPIYLASDPTEHLPAPIMIVAVPSFMIVPANDKLLLSRSSS
jgi:hypothetical protein